MHACSPRLQQALLLPALCHCKLSHEAVQCRRYIALEAGHHPYLETVPFRTIVAFTLFQALYTGAVYGLTWAGIAG